MRIPSNSPPRKRVPRPSHPIRDISLATCSSSVHSTPPPSNPSILATLSSPVRDAHLQFHDRLRDLKRDFQFMANHYMKIRDERISASLISRSANLSDSSAPSVSSISTSTLLEPDLDLDLSEYVTPSVTHE